MKNVIALAAGMCEGLGLGTNAMSALVTRGKRSSLRFIITASFCIVEACVIHPDRNPPRAFPALIKPILYRRPP